MTEGQPFPPPPDSPPPPPPPPDTPPGTGEDSPNPQPPERRLIPAHAASTSSPMMRALRDAAALALDALDYAGDRVAEKLGDVRRTRTR